jgi:phage baseplate assembly protein W
MSGPLGAGWAFPIAVDHDTGKIALVDGPDDVDQAIEIILSTAPGERPMRPEFGCAVHDYVFDGINPEMMGRVDRAVRAALDRWEPRIEVEAVDFTTRGDEVLVIDVTYRLKATNDRRNLVYPLYVVPAEDAP